MQIKYSLFITTPLQCLCSCSYWSKQGYALHDNLSMPPKIGNQPPHEKKNFTDALRTMRIPFENAVHDRDEAKGRE